MSRVQEYEAFRRATRELNSQVMEKILSRKAMDRAGKLLGIVRGDTFVFSDEKVKSASDSINRFVAFFHLYKECGLPVRYEL